MAVQHSWRGKRNVNAGLLALSILRDDVRRDLLDAWLKTDGKTSSVIAVETDALLDFIADQLPDPSHELAVCRFEQLMLRANCRARTFTAPDYTCFNSRRVIRRSLDAGIVLFQGDADVILGTLMQRLSLASFPLDETALLIAPGLQPVCRIASLQEKELWNWLVVPTASTILEHKGFSGEMIEAMLRIGALEFS